MNKGPHLFGGLSIKVRVWIGDNRAAFILELVSN